jgi:hypothetical protein
MEKLRLGRERRVLRRLFVGAAPPAAAAHATSAARA